MGAAFHKEAFSVERIAKALRASGGIVTAAAMRVPCTPRTVYNYIERYPELKTLFEELRETMLDVAESQLLTQMRNGNLTACIFFLKCRGKHRGYVERQELTGKDGGAVEMVALDQIEAAINAARANLNPHAAPPIALPQRVDRTQEAPDLPELEELPPGDVDIETDTLSLVLKAQEQPKVFSTQELALVHGAMLRAKESDD